MHHNFHSSPTITFKSRTQTITKQNQSGSSPGPADYSPTKPLKNSGNHAYSRSSRDLYSKMQLQNTPGPGSYISSEFKMGGSKYSLRMKIAEKPNGTPSPLEYDNDTLKLKYRNPGYSMRTRALSYDQLITKNNKYKPGPDKYEKPSDFQNSKQKIVFGTDKRKPLDQRQITPGPAAYDSAGSMMRTFQKSAFFKIGNGNRNSFVENPQKSPGPALYRSFSQFEDNKEKKKGFSCRSKIRDLVANQIQKVPGPGQYQPNLVNKNTAPKYSTNHKPRETFIDLTMKDKKELPPPGKHEINFASTKYRSPSCFNFTKSNRKSLYENQVTPSPLVYENQKLKILDSSPRFSVGKDITRNKKPQKVLVNSQNPGPGQYDPSLTLVRSHSMMAKVGKQKRPDFEKARYTPGPGYYDLRGKQQGPKWGFPKEKKAAFTDQKSQMKNGTFYETRASFPDAPKYMNATAKVQYQKKQN